MAAVSKTHDTRQNHASDLRSERVGRSRAMHMATFPQIMIVL
jgi:hypothetical protein